VTVLCQDIGVNETSVVFADPIEEVLIEHPWPPKGTTYVSNGIRRGRPSK